MAGLQKKSSIIFAQGIILYDHVCIYFQNHMLYPKPYRNHHLSV